MVTHVHLNKLAKTSGRWSNHISPTSRSADAIFASENIFKAANISPSRLPEVNSRQLMVLISLRELRHHTCSLTRHSIEIVQGGRHSKEAGFYLGLGMKDINSNIDIMGKAARSRCVIEELVELG
jgi:hypothetical protein